MHRKHGPGYPAIPSQHGGGNFSLRASPGSEVCLKINYLLSLVRDNRASCNCPTGALITAGVWKRKTVFSQRSQRLALTTSLSRDQWGEWGGDHCRPVIHGSRPPRRRLTGAHPGGGGEGKGEGFFVANEGVRDCSIKDRPVLAPHTISDTNRVLDS